MINSNQIQIENLFLVFSQDYEIINQRVQFYAKNNVLNILSSFPVIQSHMRCWTLYFWMEHWTKLWSPQCMQTILTLTTLVFYWNMSQRFYYRMVSRYSLNAQGLIERRKSSHYHIAKNIFFLFLHEAEHIVQILASSNLIVNKHDWRYFFS